MRREEIVKRLAGTKPSRDPSNEAFERLSGDIPAKLRIKPREIRQAAVLVPIVDHPENPTLLLTKRTDHLPDHPGQISFPGGQVEIADTCLEHTALRELEEETGVSRERVDLVGYLPPYLTITGFVVTPVVGYVKPGFVLVPDEHEVAEVFEVPLSFVLDPENHKQESREFSGHVVSYYVIQYNDYRIWGATAAMLVSFYETLQNGVA